MKKRRIDKEQFLVDRISFKKFPFGSGMMEIVGEQGRRL